MKVQITADRLEGELEILSSKSDGHRILICASLADKNSIININNTSEDIEATIGCLRALGAGIERKENQLIVTPIREVPEDVFINPKESGSTLRFLLPVTAALTKKASFTGEGRLPERPLKDLQNAMEENGTSFSTENLPFETKGRLKGKTFTMPGNVSSQYISGILFAAPLMGEEVEIHLTSPLESSAYVDMTMETMKRFGIDVEYFESVFRVKKGSYKSPGEIDVEGDFSNAAFYLAAGALEGTVVLKGLKKDTLQSDAKILDILEAAGADIVRGEKVAVQKGKLQAIKVDLKEIPDLLPILAVIASVSEGESVFYNGERLRYKETDRLETTARMIRDLGGKAEETKDGLIIQGGSLSGGETSSFGDHRIAMAASIAAIKCEKEVIIDRAEAVNKSYPAFYEDYKSLGGQAHVIDNR
ncbi:3-phosphoshikimate 1-carboxyvinyltransferase [Gallicola sp. Sow4_E12]|uniref:3-phosphoshikimate 1-carboxyvinyltransferase n=1 Tax=Gallicola sp. Sow4_E12 TaxID=3438785 RepID=UPI003F9112B8